MKPGELDQILNLAKINQDAAQAEMQEADKTIKKLLKPSKSLGQYAQQHFNPIVERMKNNDITEEEAEQLKLFAGEDMHKDLQSNTKALQMKATSMLFDLVEPLFRKDITQQVQKLNRSQIKQYATAQSKYYKALIQYGACIIIIETLTNEKANCESLTRKQLIDKTLDQHIAIVENEDIKSYFHMEIVNAINSFYEFAFNPQNTAGENQSIIINSLDLQSYLVDNTKLANNLHKLREGETAIIQNVAKGNLDITVSVSSIKTSDVKGMELLDAFDKDVLDAIYTIYNTGVKQFTTEQVYKIMSAAPRARGEYEILVDINKSIEKLMTTLTKVDCSQLLSVYPQLQGKIAGTLLNLKFLEVPAQYSNGVTINSPNVRVYVLLATPVLLQYAQYTNQLLSIPTAWRTHTRTRATKQNIAIKGVLISQILLTKDIQTSKVQYNTILEKANISIDENHPTANTQKQRLRKTICNMLDDLKEAGAILDYEPYKIGRNQVGVEIHLKTSKKAKTKKAKSK